MKQKTIFLFLTGGAIYVIFEMIFRGWSHWTMFLLGGGCFLALGCINEVIPWEMPLWKQVMIGTVIITLVELGTGCIVNLLLGWNVWDYSDLPGNFLGQICPQFVMLWIPVSFAGIVLDDYLRYYMFGEEYPHYYWRKKENDYG